MGSPSPFFPRRLRARPPSRHWSSEKRSKLRRARGPNPPGRGRPQGARDRPGGSGLDLRAEPLGVDRRLPRHPARGRRRQSDQRDAHSRGGGVRSQRLRGRRDPHVRRHGTRLPRADRGRPEPPPRLQLRRASFWRPGVRRAHGYERVAPGYHQEPGALCTIGYTSGTTAHPKGAMQFTRGVLELRVDRHHARAHPR